MSNSSGSESCAKYKQLIQTMEVAAHQCRPIKRFERMGLQGHLYPGHTHWPGDGWPKHIIFAPDSEIPPFSFRIQTSTFNCIHAE